MNEHSDEIRTAFGRETIRRASKIVLGLAALVVVLSLGSYLPGVNLLVPRTGVALGAIITALAASAVVGLLVYLAAGFASLARLALDGPKAVVENVASIAYWVVVLATVLVAHAGFGPVATALLGDAEWLYDLGFLLLALAPLLIVAVRLYVTLDPAADLLADSLADGSAESVADPDGSNGTDSADGASG